MKQKKLLSNIFLYIVVFVSILSLSAINVHATQSPVNLGSAGNFVVLTKSGISTTGTTAIVGNIGVSPIAATAITGFGLILDSSNQFSTSSLVTGKVYAANYAAPTPIMMTTAISNMQTAYTDAAGRTLPDHTELGAGNIGGMTLAPGLYKWSTGVIIPSDVILSGNANDVWIFQIAQTLSISNGKHVILIGGAQAKNIYWQVDGQTTLGTTSVFNGNILDKTAIVLKTGAILNGRALAQTAVTLDSNNVKLEASQNETNTTVNQTNQTSVNLSIAPWYPQGNNYVLICNAQGYTPTSYDWKFGDGHQLLGYNTNNVYHSYANGIYNVTCTAKNQQISNTGVLTLIVNITNAVNQTNQTNSTGNQTNGNQTNTTGVCYSSIKDIPAVCTGGIITRDDYNRAGDSCRYIVCSNYKNHAVNSVDVKICDKSGINNVNYFEMYRQNAKGIVPKLCIGNTCIQNNGYAKSSNYPICTGNITKPPCNTGNQTNQNNQTNSTTEVLSAVLSIAPWYPQGMNYIFICNSSINANSFNWDFGDGQKLLDVSNNNVWHTYSTPGTYTVKCDAIINPGTQIAKGSLVVTV